MNNIIEIAIGLAFVFFLVSVLASGVQEGIANALNSRGKMLEQAVAQLLNGDLAAEHGILGWLKDTFRVNSHLTTPTSPLKDTLAAQVLGHGLLDALFKGDRLPSYIPNDKFSDALIDCLRRRAGEQAPTAEGLLWAIHRLPASQPVYALETIIISSANDIAQIRKQFMGWYDDSMDRVSGWYARAVKYRTFVIGFALAACLQIDAIGITQSIAQDPALRSKLVAAAIEQRSGSTDAGKQEKTASDTTAPPPAPPAPPAAASAVSAINPAPATNPDSTTSPSTTVANADQKKIKDDLNALTQFGLPIGWSWCSISDKEPDAKGLCESGFDLKKASMLLAGWLIVALAVSQGAPFWFDLIGQLIALRGTGPKPAPDANKSSAVSAADHPATPAPWAATAAPSVTLPAGITADDLRNIQAKLGVPRTAIPDTATRDAVRSAQNRWGQSADGNLTMDLARQILAGRP